MIFGLIYVLYEKKNNFQPNDSSTKNVLSLKLARRLSILNDVIELHGIFWFSITCLTVSYLLSTMTRCVFQIKTHRCFSVGFRQTFVCARKQIVYAVLGADVTQWVPNHIQLNLIWFTDSHREWTVYTFFSLLILLL